MMRIPLPQLSSIAHIFSALFLVSVVRAAEGPPPAAGATLQGAGFRFQSGSPGVLIVTEKDGPPVALVPQGEPVVSDENCQTPAGPAAARTFRWEDARGYSVSWTLSRLENMAAVTMRMTFENRSGAPVNLREFQLCRSIGTAVGLDGKLDGWFVSTLDSHDSADGGFNPSAVLKAGAKHQYLDTMTLYRGVGIQGLLMGAVGPAVSDVRFHCEVTSSGIDLMISSEMNDVVVDPGETRCSEEVAVMAEPFDAATPALFKWLAATHGSRTARGPLGGWCSWYGRGKAIDSAFIDGVCDDVRANRDHLPLDLIQIDDGWEKAYGDWQADPAKFPDGMKATADRIRAAGTLPGIWLCPVRTSLNGRHPDGTANEYQDASHPAVQAFVRKMLLDRVAEGFLYFKLDFLWIKNLQTRYDRKKTRLEIAREIYRIYRESIGEDAYLDACVGGLNRACFGYADAARIGTDTSRSLKQLYKGVCMADIINATGTNAWANGILFANDPDVTYLTFRNDDLSRVWHSYVGLLGGMTLTSENLPKLDAEARRNFEVLLPPTPDKGRAFDGQTDPWHRRFGFVASRPWGNFASVLLWNPEGKPADVSLAGVPLERLGENFHVWSFWDGKYLGVSDGRFALKSLPSHASALLRLTPVTDGPVLVGSTLHIGMGSAELKELRTERNSVTIDLTDAGAREGKLFIFSHEALSLVSAQGCKAAVESAGENLWCVTLAGRQRGTPNILNLARRNSN